MAHQVFISHAAHDRTATDSLCAWLEAQGILCWMAPRNVPPGVHWGDAAADAIRQSRAVVVIFSHFAQEAPHLLREVQAAITAGLNVVVFRLENVVPGDELEYLLGGVHRVDAFAVPAGAAYPQLFQILCGRPMTTAPAPAQPPPVPAPAAAAFPAPTPPALPVATRAVAASPLPLSVRTTGMAAPPALPTPGTMPAPARARAARSGESLVVALALLAQMGRWLARALGQLGGGGRSVAKFVAIALVLLFGWFAYSHGYFALLTGEPTEAEMRAAMQQRVDALNGNINDAQHTRPQEGNPVSGIRALMGMFMGDTRYEMTSFHKIGAVKASGKPGFMCDYAMHVTVTGRFAAGANSLMGMNGDFCTARFVKVNGAWMVVPEGDD